MSGSIYPGKNGRLYLAIYPYFSDVYIKPQEGLERVAHVRYKGFREGGIDIFLLPPGYQVDEKKYGEIQPNKKFRAADKKYDIKYEITRAAQNNRLLEEIVDCVRTDVALHCCSHEAKNPTGSRIQVFNKIIPVTKARYVRPTDEIDLGGKADFVKDCIIQANKDFSIGCISEWIPGDGKSSFDGLIFKNYFLSTKVGCSYCYAGFQHFVNFPKTMRLTNKVKLEDELRKNHVHILRLGKRTETGSLYTRNQLIDTLEVCAKTKTNVIIPTKYLEYDAEVAGLLKKTNSVVLFSIGYDKLEPGACAHGCDNEFRLEQAKKYRSAGINSCIYLLTDITSAPGKRENRVLRFATKNKIPVQMLPMRIMNRKMAPEVTGREWDQLKMHKKDSNLALFAQSPDGGCYKKGGNSLIAQKVDEEWLKLVINNNNENHRMCHHDDKLTYCGRCFLQKKDDGYLKGIIAPTTHTKVNYKFLAAKRARRTRSRAKQNQKFLDNTSQLQLLE